MEENDVRLEIYEEKVTEILEQIKIASSMASELEEANIINNNSVTLKAIWADITWMKQGNNVKL